VHKGGVGIAGMSERCAANDGNRNGGGELEAGALDDVGTSGCGGVAVVEALMYVASFDACDTG
jgi:hypothetical protein